MTVFPPSPGASSETSMMNASAAGVQKGLLEALRLASLERLCRMLRIVQSFKAQQAIHHWHIWTKSDVWSRHHKDIKESIGHKHDGLERAQRHKVAEIRRNWNEKRAKLIEGPDGIGYRMDDHIAVAPDDVHHLRALDKHYRDQLNQQQQGHLESSEILHGHSRQLTNECTTNLQAIALMGLGKDLLHRHDTSKAAMGRTWQLGDMHPGALQWSFTRRPEDCMVPFPQAVAIEQQQEELANTCRLILEYADKLPRWHQLASTRQGRPSCKRQSNAAVQLFKCALRRVQVRHCLQPAFHGLLEAALHPRQLSLGRLAWQKARTAVQKHREQVKEEEMEKIAQLAARQHEEHAGVHSHPRRKTHNRNSMHIQHGFVKSLTTSSFKKQRSRIISGESSASPGSKPAAESGSAWDVGVQNMHRRQNRTSCFVLGDDESAPFRRTSASYSPRSVGSQAFHRSSTPLVGGSPEVLHWADETPGDKLHRNSSAAKFDEPSSDDDSENEDPVHQPAEPAKAHAVSASLQEASLPPMPGERDLLADAGTTSEASIPAHVPIHEHAKGASIEVIRNSSVSSDSDSTTESESEDESSPQSPELPI